MTGACFWRQKPAPETGARKWSMCHQLNYLCCQNLGQKTTLSEFISSLASVNDGENFPSDKLRELYDAVVTSPLQFEA